MYSTVLHYHLDIIERVMLRSQPPFRPSIDEVLNADEALISLMTKCWVENPHDRPEFPAIRKQVRLLNKYALLYFIS